MGPGAAGLGRGASWLRAEPEELEPGAAAAAAFSADSAEQRCVDITGFGGAELKKERRRKRRVLSL